MTNPKVLAGLNSATKTTDIYASLIDEINVTSYLFLFNPEKKVFSRQANYTPNITALSSLPSQQYNNTSGLVLELPNLLLETYSQNKSCKLLLQKLQGLMVADPSKGQYSPTPVKFVWGSDSFGPSVITNLSWEETSWLNGEVASARVNLTLLEIPSPQKPVDSASQKEQEMASNNQNTLTNREKTDALSKADKWLSTNIKKLIEKPYTSVRTNKYKLYVSDRGIITINDSKNIEIGIVGNYINGKFTTTNNNILKI